MPTYVKAPGRDTWHWCTNCSNYPATIGDSVTLPAGQRPGSGELDNECLSKERDGECSS